MQITSHDFGIFYKNKKKHTNTDAMSIMSSLEVNASGWKEKWPQEEERSLRNIQRRDKFCKAIIQRIKDICEQKNMGNKKGEKGNNKDEGFFKENGLLYHEERGKKGEDSVFQLVVPSKLVTEILFLTICSIREHR